MKKMNVKKMLVLTTMMIMTVFALTACGKKNDNESKPTQAPTVTTTPTQAAEVTQAPTVTDTPATDTSADDSTAVLPGQDDNWDDNWDDLGDDRPEGADGPSMGYLMSQEFLEIMQNGGISDEKYAYYEEIFPGFKEMTADMQYDLVLANALSLGSYVEISLGAMEVEPDTYLQGIHYKQPNLTGFNTGAVIMPFIGAQPFIAYVFTTDDNAAANALAEQIKTKADPRWNICTEADETYIEVYDKYVFFTMTPAAYNM